MRSRFEIPYELPDRESINPLRRSRLMVDKITTVSKTKLCARIGRISDKDTVRLNRAILVFFGLTG